MTDRIDLTGIEVYAKHGVLQREQEKAQVFRIDVSAFTDLSRPGETDDIADALDYSELALEVREVVGSVSNQLIEKVAADVAEAVLAHPQVTKTIVTIHKPNAPIDMAFDDVSVTIERVCDQGDSST